MFNWVMAGLMVIGIIGMLLVWYMNNKNQAVAWKVCSLYFGPYAIVMEVAPLVAIAKHWTTFDRVVGMFFAGAIAGLATLIALSDRISRKEDTNKH